MKLLLTGPSGSGKSHRIRVAFRAAAKSQSNDCRLVVPTATLAQHLRNELAREGLLFNPTSILTLSSFEREIASDPLVADNVTLQLAARIAAREVNAPEFASVGTMAGFHAAIAQTIGELDSAGCDAAQFSRMRIDAPLARPLVTIWRHIEAQLARRGLLTRGQLTRRATVHVREREVPRYSRVWFDGFMGFTRPELDLIEALADRADVTVALPQLATAAPALQDLVSAGFQFELLEGPEDRPQAAWFQAANLEREADEIARRILLFHQLGRPFRDIAVVLRSPEGHVKLLETAFERFGIPARFYFTSRLAEHPIAAFAMLLVDALREEWNLETLLKALRLAPNLAATPAMDRWDIEIRERLPASGIDALRESAGDDRVRSRVVDELASMENWRAAQWTAQRWADVIADIPHRFRPPRPDDGAGWSEMLVERARAAATGQFAQALRSAAEWLAPQGLIGLGEFWETAAAVLKLTPLRVPDARRNVVHIMSVYEARQWDPPVMFLPNLAEKVFPHYHPQDPFLPDPAIRQLQSLGVRVRDSKDRDEEESCLFDTVARRPGREICLSYPRLNARGDENLRSAFFQRVDLQDSQVIAVKPAPWLAAPLRRTAIHVRASDLLERIARRNAAFSPSSLESYARCPFQFFAGRTLRLQNLPDTPEDRLNYLVQGTIVHDTMKEWTATRGPVQPVFDTLFAAACAREHIPSTYRTEVKRREMLGALETFCSAFETFGSPRTEQSFEFQLLPGIGLRGRIDRVDELPDGSLVVVDYKYSNNLKANVDDASKLQGVLYTAATERLFGARPRATIFISLRDRKHPVGWGQLADHNLLPMSDEWVADGIAAVERLVGEIRAGVVQPAPSNQSHCERCDFRDVCRYESEPTTPEVPAVKEAVAGR